MQHKKTATLTIIFIMLLFSVTTNAFVSKKEESKNQLSLSEDVMRIDFVHYAKSNYARPAKTENCYQLMGVKWKSLPVSYSINLINSNLDELFVINTISTSAETWDGATTSEIFNNQYNIDNEAVYGIYDGKNSITFGAYPQNNVIAVTSVWYTKRNKEILEFDQLYNTNFAWGNADIDSSVMDLQNIATHEFGHAIGLSDIYSTTCNLVTMYGYSTYGETQKRSLEQADIKGLQIMYGI